MPPKKRTKVGAASTPQADSQPKSPVENGQADSPQEGADEINGPWTDDQEALLFKNLIRCKPTGIHKHFRMISISQDLESHGYSSVSLESVHLRIPGIWSKLGQLYDLEVLDEREYNHELSAFPDALDSEEEEELPEFRLPEDEFADEMWARRLRLKDDKRSTSPAEFPELQASRDEPAPIPVGASSVASDAEKEDANQASPPVRGRATRGARGGKGRATKATPAGRGSKAQSNNSVSVSESAEDSEDDDDEEESSDDANQTTRTGRASKRGRPARRGRKR